MNEEYRMLPEQPEKNKRRHSKGRRLGGKQIENCIELLKWVTSAAENLKTSRQNLALDSNSGILI